MYFSRQMNMDLFLGGKLRMLVVIYYPIWKITRYIELTPNAPLVSDLTVGAIVDMNQECKAFNHEKGSQMDQLAR